MENQANNGQLPEEPISSAINSEPHTQSNAGPYSAPARGPYSGKAPVVAQNGKKKMWIIIAVVVGAIVLLAVLGKVFFSKVSFSDNIDVLSIEGLIGPSVDTGLFGSVNTYDHDYLMETVDDLIEDDKNKAIMLNINTPGGAVYQTDELYLKLMEYKEKTGRPIYASFGQIACSGGYYLAMASDQIYTNRNTITGSIGVISGTFMDFSKVIEKYGIKAVDITSGRNKNMGSQFHEMTEEQKQIFQSYVDESYSQFVSIVDEGRKDLNLEQVKVLADGRIYTAKQALDSKLVDKIGSFEDAIDGLKADYQLEECDVVYRHSGDSSGFFNQLYSSVERIMPKSDAQVIEEYLNKVSFGYICPQFVR